MCICIRKKRWQIKEMGGLLGIYNRMFYWVGLPSDRRSFITLPCILSFELMVTVSVNVSLRCLQVIGYGNLICGSNRNIGFDTFFPYKVKECDKTLSLGPNPNN